MNIRFSILLIVLSGFLIVPALAQGSPKITDTSQVGGTSGAVSGKAAPSANLNAPLPNEKTLLIGGAANGATGTVKPIKALGAWDYIQMVLVLALVIAGIYVLFYFLKRAGGPRYQENAVIGVLSTKVLQPNRSIHLIDVGGQLYLVGTSENNVNLVAAIEKKEAIDEIRLRTAQNGPRPGRKTFRDAFSGASRKGGLGFAGSVMDSMSFIKQQRERLKKM